MKRPIAWAAAVFTLAACTTAPRPSTPEVVASAPAPSPSAPQRQTPPTAAAQPPTAAVQPPAAAAQPPATASKSPKSAPAKSPTVAAKVPAPKAPASSQPPAAVATAPPAAPAAAPAAPLDLRSLEQRLRETNAIGVMTKLSLKNQVDDLLGKFRAYYQGELKVSLAELRHPYELLLMKVLSLLQDGDPALARDVNASRDAIWAVLTDRNKFFQFV